MNNFIVLNIIENLPVPFNLKDPSLETKCFICIENSSSPFTRLVLVICVTDPVADTVEVSRMTDTYSCFNLLCCPSVHCNSKNDILSVAVHLAFLSPRTILFKKVLFILKCQ